jgi:hypothetical protein
VTTSADESLPQTLQLITDGQTVMQTQVDSRSAIQQWASDLRLVTDTFVEMDPDLRSIVINAPDAGAALERLVENAGPGLGSLVRNFDILNGVTIPRLDGVEQMLVTYPDVVSGGFTVVRRDADGEMRSHFGFVINAGDPHPCTTGYVETTRLPSPSAVATADVDAVACQVINGVDPTPGDDHDEAGSNIRGEQNIGRDGGSGSGRPQGEFGSHPPITGGLSSVVNELLHASPFAFTTG